MFSDYIEIENYEIKPEFEKEFICPWPEWLGIDNLHKLDEVTKDDWAKFNTLVRLISKVYKMALLDCQTQSILDIDDIEKTLSNYEDSMNKDASKFSKYLIPELDCILSEEWDFTYILWHKNGAAIEAIDPFITKAGLYHFHD